MDVEIGAQPHRAALCTRPPVFQQLVAEAQRLLSEGKLVEARNKVLEAQRLGVRFGPDEVSPELVYQQVSVEARKKIDILVRESHETASYGAGDAKVRYRAAEAKLTEARQLAGSFGQDTVAVDVQLAPGERRRIALGVHLDGPAVDRDLRVAVTDLAVEHAVRRVVLEHVREDVGRCEVVQRDDLEVGLPLQVGPEEVPADPSESVDRNAFRHDLHSG